VLALLAAQPGVWAFTDGSYLSANMSTRGEIMAYILTNPGVYLREISDDLALPMGVVQYHLWVLGKNGELEECRSGRYRRFFGAARYPETKRKVLSLLRQGTAGRILSSLSEEPLTHMKLAAILGISSQALSWHVRRLREMGMIEIETQNRGQRTYVLPDFVCQEVQTYLASLQKEPPVLFEASPVR
jgi:predicted transcriptional regulator